MAISDKLTYLNTTKSLIRDGINAIGGELTSSDTFRSYVNALNDIYDYLPKITGTGTSITLNDTAKGKMILELEPSELSQDETPTPSSPQDIHTISGSNTIKVVGKNLYNGEISATNQRLSTSTGGGYATTGWSISSYVAVKPNTTYTLSTEERIFCDEYDNNKTFIKGVAQTYGVTDPITITTTSTTKYVRFDFPTGNVSLAMIEVGNTATEYTPFVQPQEANINLGDIEYCEIGDYKDEFVRSSGKNLFDKDNVNVLNAYIDSTNGNIGNGNNVKSIYIPCKANTSYTISKIVTPRFIVGLTSTLPANGVTCLSFKRDDNATHLTLEGNENAKYIVVYLTNNYDSNTWNNIINSLMINEGSTALPYEPYGIGNWGIRKNIGKHTFEDCVSATPNSSGETSYQSYLGNLNDMLSSNWGYGFSNYFIRGTQKTNNVIRFGVNNQQIYVYTNDENFANKTSADNWLLIHNVIVYYILATPTYTPITGTLETQLENVYKNMLSQAGQTNISQVNNDLAFEISASALQDLSTL